MNTNQLETVVADILQKSADAIGKGIHSSVEVATTQLPLVADEYIRWKIVSGFSRSVALVVVIVALMLVVRWCIREKSFDSDMRGGLGAACATIAGVLLVVFAFTCADGPRALVQPRILLIEAALSVANGRGLP